MILRTFLNPAGKPDNPMKPTMVPCAHPHTSLYRKYFSTTLLRCHDCQLLFSKDRPSPAVYRERYRNYYKNELPSRFGFGLELLVRLFRFFRSVKITTIAPRAKTILDIGCGRGFMLYFLKIFFGFSTTVGTQIAPRAAEFARNKLGLTIFDTDLLDIDFSVERFDLITIWHVLEHVLEPEAYIIRMGELLNDKGKLLIEVPNFTSWTCALTQQYWLGLDPQYHLSHFGPASLCAMLRKHGFTINKVHTHSLEYSTFISVQSLVSRITGTDQFLFQWIQNPRPDWRLFFHLLLFMLITPICFLINLCLYFSRKGEVLLVIAEKESSVLPPG